MAQPAAERQLNPLFQSGDHWTWKETIAKNLNEGTITKDDAEILTSYINDKSRPGRKGMISSGRAVHLASYLCNFRKFHPEYSSMTGRTIIEASEALATGKSERGTPYADNTRREMLTILKGFSRWLVKNKKIGCDLETINAAWDDEIGIPEVTTMNVTSSDILDDGKINKLVNACNTIRDRALVVVLAETGARPKEAANLRWRDLVFNDHSVQITIIEGKDARGRPAEKPAFVTLRKSVIHELRKSQALDGPDDWIFRQFVSSNSTRIGKEPISPSAVRNVMRYACESTGIKLPKGCKAKILRASSVTNKVASGVPLPAVMKTHWKAGLNSKMFKHYEKLCPTDTEKMILSASGNVTEILPVANDDNTQIKCLCGFENAPRSMFCAQCGSPLTEKAINEKEHFTKVADDEIRRELDELKRQIAALSKK